jgi:hypothetical protein
MQTFVFSNETTPKAKILANAAYLRLGRSLSFFRQDFIIFSSSSIGLSLQKICFDVNDWAQFSAYINKKNYIQGMFIVFILKNNKKNCQVLALGK